MKKPKKVKAVKAPKVVKPPKLSTKLKLIEIKNTLSGGSRTQHDVDFALGLLDELIAAS